MAFVSRFPREVLAPSFVARITGKPLLSVWAQSGPRTPNTDFCKRSVPVASCSVQLRKVAYEYQATPRSVLLGSFEKTRRAARTDKYERMSGRLARTFRKPVAMSQLPRNPVVPTRPQVDAASRDWRQLRSVVASVLSKAKISPAGIVSTKTGG